MISGFPSTSHHLMEFGETESIDGSPRTWTACRTRLSSQFFCIWIWIWDDMGLNSKRMTYDILWSVVNIRKGTQYGPQKMRSTLYSDRGNYVWVLSHIHILTSCATVLLSLELNIRNYHRSCKIRIFQAFDTWGWVKTLVPLVNPQVIAGIYGCSSH
jgi:hypothetical protein